MQRVVCRHSNDMSKAAIECGNQVAVTPDKASLKSHPVAAALLFPFPVTGSYHLPCSWACSSCALLKTETGFSPLCNGALNKILYMKTEQHDYSTVKPQASTQLSMTF